MFKLESYITPVILSYVEKYVKNFKPEQYQLSLWGGDASFQNLDLRLEVLEQQLNLPFTFVSGHVHELLIHVPWVKITSEPIIVTINTIECILKLKDDKQMESIPKANFRNQLEISQEETPPGYIKNIVTKVINNITINCNNLILKYVEEDIVLSMNVKFFSIKSVNNKWEPCFSDINGYQINLYKLIDIQDLTLCLDKMDTSGKIEIYQDPVLYRCSMCIRLIMNYNSNKSRRASLTKLDLCCEKMEFSITEQQIPMILRLIALLQVLQMKQFPIVKEEIIKSTDDNNKNVEGENSLSTESNGESSWGMWVWNNLSSVLPVDWDNDWSNEQQSVHSNNVLHIGMYIKDTTLTFKTVESIKEQLFYKSRKIKYNSFLTLHLQETSINVLLQGISMLNFTIGFSHISLYPRGTCSCGHVEVIDGMQPPLYFIAGKKNENYLKDTLFDDNAIENCGEKRIYCNDISQYLTTTTDSMLFTKCPAFFMDYVHETKIPEDITAEQLSEFGPTFEYSNFLETRFIRYGIGDFIMRVCSGFLHRIDTVKKAAGKYDYSPYVITKPAPTVDELPPVTVEEYEALSNVPLVTMSFHLIKGSIQLQLADHRITGLPKFRKYVENRTISPNPTFSDDPYVSIEWDEITATIRLPLYPFRLIACASKQTNILPEMLNQCYRYYTLKIKEIRSKLFLRQDCQFAIMMPCNMEYDLQTLLFPEYWIKNQINHSSHNFKVNDVTLTGSKPKIMVVISVLTSILYPEYTENPLVCSSLYVDACEENVPIYLELCLENIACKIIEGSNASCCNFTIKSLKMFVHNETQQAFLLCGPEDMNNSSSKPSEASLLSAVMQFPKNSNGISFPSLLFFDISPIKGCLDPLFLQWLDYHIVYYRINTIHKTKCDMPQSGTESTIIDTASSRKRTFPSLHESVHSSSDKEKKKAKSNDAVQKSSKKSCSKNSRPDNHFYQDDSVKEEDSQKTNVLRKAIEQYPRWSNLILNGSIDHVILYIPSSTISGLGTDDIESAKNRELTLTPDLEILVIKTPKIIINSANIHHDQLSLYVKNIPIILPDEIWIHQNQSFPWTLSVSDFECITIKQQIKQNLVKKISFNVTIDVTTKNFIASSTENTVSSLNLNVYIDTTPISISLCQAQVKFLRDTFSNLWKIFMILPMKQNIDFGSKVEKNVFQGINQTSPTPTQLPFVEENASTSSVSVTEDILQSVNDLSITACIQWTIAKIILNLYVTDESNISSSKLRVESEDIITSIDLQPVYLKIKHKTTTAVILHYRRPHNSQNWELAENTGLLMSGREDSFEKGDDSGFVTLTVTMAKSGNVHTKWGTKKSNRIHKKDIRLEELHLANKYITEIVLKLQMIDMIAPLDSLKKYIEIIMAFLSAEITLFEEPKEMDTFITPPFMFVTKLKTDILPLLYLDFRGLRLTLPTKSSRNKFSNHGILVIQMESINIKPNADNPICRNPFRPDIYQLAAQENILNVPGSSVEDRQYQISINNICVHTTTWQDYLHSISKRTSQSYLYTMNENPAVEWNKLGCGSSLEPQFSSFPVMSRFDCCVIVAPAITYKPDVLVCASAIEINCITDIDLTMSLDQLELLSQLYFELLLLIPERKKNIVTVTQNVNFSSKDFENNCIQPFASGIDSDFTKDSGVDFESSTNSSKPITQVFSPYEVLINCGRISFILYEEEAFLLDSENANQNFTNSNINCNNKPVMYISVNQPNFYYSQRNTDQKIQISCFDVALAFGQENIENISFIPTVSNFNTYVIETKNGKPHTDTGIPPSFLTMKYHNLFGKNPYLGIDFGRPTKFHLSIFRLNQFLFIKEKITNAIQNKYATTINSKYIAPKTFQQENLTKNARYPILNFNLSIDQCVLSYQIENKYETLFSISSLNGGLENTGSEMFGNLTINSLIISNVFENQTQIFLHPWNLAINFSLIYESWLNTATIHRVQFQADSNSINIDFCANHVQILNDIIMEVNALSNTYFQDKINSNKTNIPDSSFIEQHYMDDLKSGAFQFVDDNSEEFPFPYQVIFTSYPHQAMVWRYPHPRALMKIHVAPVPFEIETYEEENPSYKIKCILEYWDEIQMTWQRYVNFHLSENESYQFDLTEINGFSIVASIWRIVLVPTTETIKNLFSTRALVACSRIDSYFNPNIIPNIQAVFKIGLISISIFNRIDLSSYKKLPTPLDVYKFDGIVPDSQCFASIEHKNVKFVFQSWSNKAHNLKIVGSFRVHVLNYGLLILQEVLYSKKETINVHKDKNNELSLHCTNVSIKLDPAVCYTIAISARIWTDYLERKSISTILTKYVVANNTNIPIRFGQSSTDDNILLNSRYCTFYSWRQLKNRVIRIAIEGKVWVWSRPFSIDQDKLINVQFPHNSLDVTISAQVTSLSATQKLITFTGQLIISNQTDSAFEMKLVKYDTMSQVKSIVSRDIFELSPFIPTPTVVVPDKVDMAMRLRFAKPPNLSWTGDIPLQYNMRWTQPWLVKVPLQERGQFLSIWVRIVTEHIDGKEKKLAILSPLYLIKSYLPLSVNVEIETPSLKYLSKETICGRGEKQQLSTPGTFEHSHNLTFKLQSGISASDPYVPLSFNVIDQKKFFKRPEKENIQDILKQLDSIKNASKWPFQADEFTEWIPAEQPQTHIQIKYEDAGLISSTLLIELQPWCLLLNTTGCPISIITNNTELCLVPNCGVVAPPKLEGTFHFVIHLDTSYHLSPLLQLEKIEWGQSFYTSLNQGIIPLEGNYKFAVDCYSSICMLSLNTSVQKDMRLIRMNSSYFISNMTEFDLTIATIAVPNSLKNLLLPNDIDHKSFQVLHDNDQRNALPILRWHTPYDRCDDSLEFYIILRFGETWSCPISIDQAISRKCISLQDISHSIPFVITTQEDRSLTYIIIHKDIHPQLCIQNDCFFNVIVGQANKEGDDIVPDSKHFHWFCLIRSGTSTYYTLPTERNRVPDSPNQSDTSILISAIPKNIRNIHENDESLHWSRIINLTNNINPIEQTVHLSQYGDIQLTMFTRCYTTYIHLSVMSKEHNDQTCEDSGEMVYHKTPAKDANNILSPNMKLENNSKVSILYKEIAKKSHRKNLFSVHFEEISIKLSKDIRELNENVEIANITLLDIFCIADVQNICSTISICVGDLQFDNQLYDQRGFDFPVVIIAQKPFQKKIPTIYFYDCLKKNFENVVEYSMFNADFMYEVNNDTRACKDVCIKLAPVSAYIEGSYIMHLTEYISSLFPSCVIDLEDSPTPSNDVTSNSIPYQLKVPDFIIVDATILSSPLRLRNLIIEPITILLSVHTSIHLYVAFDHSPLYFDAFESKNLFTTPYRLGNALTMHYLSGAIFGVGWVVGSLEILGSPGSLAQALGSGIKDFVSMPFNGLLQGPWGFIVGITQGSASLMRHVTAGTVNSLTKLASSVARNLDRLTLDEEHLLRQEEYRRTRPQGMAQGLYQGLTSFGMSLLGALAGIAHHPLQQIWSGDTSTRGLVTGVGLGLVGVVTKPLSGAAELVALTGQGLLEGAGWNSLPLPRNAPQIPQVSNLSYCNLRFTWRLLPLLAKNKDIIVYIVDAEHIIQHGNNKSVTIVLTKHQLLIINTLEDSIEKILYLKDLTLDTQTDSTIFKVFCLTNQTRPNNEISPEEPAEMNQQMRARVAEFVRTSSTGIASVSSNSDAQSDTQDSVSLLSDSSLTFILDRAEQSQLVTVFNEARRQSQNNGFTVF